MVKLSHFFSPESSKNYDYFAMVKGHSHIVGISAMKLLVDLAEILVSRLYLSVTPESHQSIG